MNVHSRSARRRVAQPLSRPIARGTAIVAALALAVSTLTALTAPPASAAPGDQATSWVEVEDGVIGSGSAGPPALNSGDHSNFSGTGSYTFRETGMSSTMTVTVPTAGTYPIHVRYAAGPLSPEENVTRTMGLVTNGVVRQQMRLPLTGDWDTWKFVTYEVNLNQGANTVALQCDRSIDICRLNFDAIQIGGTAPDLCAPVTPNPAYSALFDGTFASFDGWRKAESGSGGFGRQTDCTIQSVRGRGAEWFIRQQTAPYTLKLDWRRKAADDESSVYLASAGIGSADPVGGFRIPIGDNTGDVVPTGGTTQPADQAAVAAALRPVGQWNTYTILLTRTDVAVYLNDTLVNTFVSPTTIPLRGYIGLENRGAGHDVSFRSIQLRQGAVPDAVDSTTSINVAPAAVPVGQGASVAVSVSAGGRTPAGEVEIYVDGIRSSTVTLRDAKAVATIGPFQTAGSRSVEVIYFGDATTRPSISTIATLKVEQSQFTPPAAPTTKATPTITMKVRPGTVTVGKTKARIAIVVSATGAVATGRVTFKVGKTTRTATLRGGKVTMKLPRFKQSGKARLRTSYSGDALINPAVSTNTIRVKKPRG